MQAALQKGRVNRVKPRQRTSDNPIRVLLLTYHACVDGPLIASSLRVESWARGTVKLFWRAKGETVSLVETADVRKTSTSAPTFKARQRSACRTLMWVSLGRVRRRVSTLGHVAGLKLPADEGPRASRR